MKPTVVRILKKNGKYDYVKTKMIPVLHKRGELKEVFLPPKCGVSKQNPNLVR